jgi:hypothetical protein
MSPVRNCARARLNDKIENISDGLGTMNYVYYT